MHRHGSGASRPSFWQRGAQLTVERTHPVNPIVNAPLDVRGVDRVAGYVVEDCGHVSVYALRTVASLRPNPAGCNCGSSKTGRFGGPVSWSEQKPENPLVGARRESDRPAREVGSPAASVGEDRFRRVRAGAGGCPGAGGDGRSDRQARFSNPDRPTRLTRIGPRTSSQLGRLSNWICRWLNAVGVSSGCGTAPAPRGRAAPSVGPLESLEYGPRVHGEALHVALVERRHRVVVGLVPLVLQVDEVAREIAYLDAEGTHLATRPARLLSAPVVQAAVDAHPARLAAHVLVEELVRTALGQTVEQGVVDSADRSAEVRLERSPPARGDEICGRGQEVRRSQAKDPSRRPWRRGAYSETRRLPCSRRCPG